MPDRIYGWQSPYFTPKILGARKVNQFPLRNSIHWVKTRIQSYWRMLVCSQWSQSGGVDVTVGSRVISHGNCPQRWVLVYSFCYEDARSVRSRHWESPCPGAEMVGVFLLCPHAMEALPSSLSYKAPICLLGLHELIISPKPHFLTLLLWLQVMASSYGFVRKNRIIQIIEDGESDKWGLSHMIHSFQGAWTAGSSSTTWHHKLLSIGLYTFTLFMGWIAKL